MQSALRFVLLTLGGVAALRALGGASERVREARANRPLSVDTRALLVGDSGVTMAALADGKCTLVLMHDTSIAAAEVEQWRAALATEPDLQLPDQWRATTILVGVDSLEPAEHLRRELNNASMPASVAARLLRVRTYPWYVVLDTAGALITGGPGALRLPSSLYTADCRIALEGTLEIPGRSAFGRLGVP